ncbi:PREDICTED: neurohemerythrin-like [Priapulus caudatus]|uniref:Neurohemerythrin-like n=1 Tax=Priapulus caudatus TaxID=37621 RepID=A0ABM1EK99_PRICU|nr:PREDICTED: neurohemerythrin-like [Priapulus caudatus]
MACDLPEPYCWDESFQTFYTQIDGEHKFLFNAIFDVAGDRASNDKLQSLKDLMNGHFQYEEGMMARGLCRNLDSHKKIHEEFLAKLDAFTCPVKDERINWVKDWLVSHIKSIDFKYKGMLD